MTQAKSFPALLERPPPSQQHDSYNKEMLIHSKTAKSMNILEIHSGNSNLRLGQCIK
jgi:hypothetical protein